MAYRGLPCIINQTVAFFGDETQINPNVSNKQRKGTEMSIFTKYVVIFCIISMDYWEKRRKQ
jgi:hypothetical protein